MNKVDFKMFLIWSTRKIAVIAAYINIGINNMYALMYLPRI